MSYENSNRSSSRSMRKVFSEEEIDGIISFYKSPAGKAMIEKSPLLMQRVMP